MQYLIDLGSEAEGLTVQLWRRQREKTNGVALGFPDGPALTLWEPAGPLLSRLTQQSASRANAIIPLSQASFSSLALPAVSTPAPAAPWLPRAPAGHAHGRLFEELLL